MASSVRVLVVHDSETSAVAIRDHLITQEYDVEILASSREAYEDIVDEGKRYDLLIVEVNLPGIDGITLTKRLRGKEVLTPTLLLSDSLDPAVRISITTMGPSVDHLEKGAGRDLLLAACTGLLANNHLLMKVCKLDDRLGDLHQLFSEKIPGPAEISRVVKETLEDHCPALHHEVMEESGKRLWKTRSKMEKETEVKIEAATALPAVLASAKRDPLFRILTGLLGVMVAGFLTFTGYSYRLADGASRDIIQVKSTVEQLSMKIDLNMTQQTAQMNRVEESLDRLILSAPSSRSTSPTRATILSPFRLPSPKPLYLRNVAMRAMTALPGGNP